MGYTNKITTMKWLEPHMEKLKYFSQTREDGILADLQRDVPKPQSRDTSKNTLILESTWRLVNERVSAR